MSAAPADGGNTPPPWDLIDEVDTAGLKVTVVRAAMELDVFTAVARGASDVPRLAAATNASQRGLAVLVRALLSLGLLEADDGVLRCSPTAAAYLSADSPGCSTAIYLTWFRNRDRIVDAIRTGRSPGAHGEHEAPDDWCAYASMEMIRWPLRAVSVPKNLALHGLVLRPGARILDAGCGSGIIGFALARADPAATVVSVDRPGVLGVADRLAREMHVRDRVELVAGDVDRTAYGEDRFDIVLLVNVAQYLTDHRLHATLVAARRALRADGQLYLSTPVIDAGSLGHMVNWTSAVEMFLAAGVDQRTEDDVLARLREAGFGDVTQPVPNAFVAVRRALP